MDGLTGLGMMPMLLLLLAVAFELFWKGIGLWKASKNDEKGWFVVMLVVNTVGILPLLYIFFFQKGKKGL